MVHALSNYARGLLTLLQQVRLPVVPSRSETQLRVRLQGAEVKRLESPKPMDSPTGAHRGVIRGCQTGGG
jgi:hypothetical protein